METIVMPRKLTDDEWQAIRDKQLADDIERYGMVQPRVPDFPNNRPRSELVVWTSGGNKHNGRYYYQYLKARDYRAIVPLRILEGLCPMCNESLGEDTRGRYGLCLCCKSAWNITDHDGRVWTHIWLAPQGIKPGYIWVCPHGECGYTDSTTRRLTER